MDRAAIETWPSTLREAALIVGFKESALVNLVARKRPFPEKQRGTGYQLHFIMHDLMTLMVIKRLIDFGLSQDDAVILSPSAAGLYGCMKNDRQPVDLAFREIAGRRTGGPANGSEALVIRVDLWAIWDRLYPNFRTSLLERDSLVSQSDRESALAAYEAHMTEVRSRGLAKPTQV